MKLIEKFLKHFTDLENIRNSNSYKFMKYLETNNFKDCQVKKDTKEPIYEGKFNFKLIDRMGNVVDECFSINEKKAWDTLIERHADKQNILNNRKTKH